MHTRLAKLAATWLPLRLLPLPIPLALPHMTEVLQWPTHQAAEPGNLWLRKLMQETAARL